jgi:hypothetical protein
MTRKAATFPEERCHEILHAKHTSFINYLAHTVQLRQHISLAN